MVFRYSYNLFFIFFNPIHLQVVCNLLLQVCEWQYECIRRISVCRNNSIQKSKRVVRYNNIYYTGTTRLRSEKQRNNCTRLFFTHKLSNTLFKYNSRCIIYEQTSKETRRKIEIYNTNLDTISSPIQEYLKSCKSYFTKILCQNCNLISKLKLCNFFVYIFVSLELEIRMT